VDIQVQFEFNTILLIFNLKTLLLFHLISSEMPPKILPNVCKKCRTDKKACTISDVKNSYSCGECIAAKRVCSLTVNRHLAIVSEKKRKKAILTFLSVLVL